MRTPQTPLRARLTALLTSLTALTAAALLTTAPTAHAADPSLRDLAAAKGKGIGTAVTGSKLTGTYGEIAAREFSWLTPGNAMKWASVEPTRGTFDWTEADRIVDFAEAHDQDVRGHTLVWHSQNPNWLANGTWTPAQLGQLMKDHIALEVGRYKGRLAAWDVVNEPFNEDGTYRQTLWYNGLGTDYIAQALTAARAADPAAKLYINDYNVEGVNAKSTALYNLVRDLKARGVPIDGVGLQAHLILGQVPATLQQNIQRFADLGVDVAITELDIRMQLPATQAKLAQQRTEYETVVKACVAVTRCTALTVWGFTDSDSWIPDTFPGEGAATPYDENYAPKPAYQGIVTALGGTVTEPPVPAGCSAAYTVANQWNTGFTGNVTIRCAAGSSLSSWRLNWTFGAGQQLSQAWNATCTQTGAAVSCSNASWNGGVPSGGSVSFGFNGTWSGTNPVPTVTLG